MGLPTTTWRPTATSGRRADARRRGHQLVARRAGPGVALNDDATTDCVSRPGDRQGPAGARLSRRCPAAPDRGRAAARRRARRPHAALILAEPAPAAAGLVVAHRVRLLCPVTDMRTADCARTTSSRSSHHLPVVPRSRHSGMAVSAAGRGQAARVLHPSTEARGDRRSPSTSRCTSTSSTGVAVLATNIRGSTGYASRTSASSSATGAAATCRTGSTPRSGCATRTGWTGQDRRHGGLYGLRALTCVTRSAGALGCGRGHRPSTSSRSRRPCRRCGAFIARFLGDPEHQRLPDGPLADHLRRERDACRRPSSRARRTASRKAASDQLVDKLKSLGREVEYVVFDDEGHGFTKRANELRAYRLAAEWLERASRFELAHCSGTALRPRPGRSRSRSSGGAPRRPRRRGRASR